MTDAADTLIFTVSPGCPASFVADGHPVTLSSDSATMLPANARVAERGNDEGAAGLSASGELFTSNGIEVDAKGIPAFKTNIDGVYAGGDAMRGPATVVEGIADATWFANADQALLTIAPAIWKNEVITCYLKTAVPVELSGVQWLYGEPAMAQGYTYVIALQQIEPTTVLANLAYVLPQ